SKRPVIVTFGAGACASTGGASIARATTAKTAVTRTFLITASSEVVSSNLPPRCQCPTPTSPTTPAKAARREANPNDRGRPPRISGIYPLISFRSRKNCYLALVSPSARGASSHLGGPSRGLHYM